MANFLNAELNDYINLKNDLNNNIENNKEGFAQYMRNTADKEIKTAFFRNNNKFTFRKLIDKILFVLT